MNTTISRSSPDHSGRIEFRHELFYLLVGGGLGAGLALLFAPKSGAELRGDISEITRNGYDETLEAAQHLKEQTDEFYQSIKERADRVYDLAARKLSLVPPTIDKNIERAGEVILGETGKAAKKDAARSSAPARRALAIF